jgi:hypothetical protein
MAVLMAGTCLLGCAPEAPRMVSLLDQIAEDEAAVFVFVGTLLKSGRLNRFD